MARRARAAPPIASVTWRDGVHLTDTPIWCDARRRRDVCFVSSADRVGKTGHGQLIATSLTLALLGASGGGHLAVPLRKRFTLGTLRLELIPSGRGPGAAALHVDIAGKTVLYAGAIRTDGSEPAEVRACDAVVIGAHHAQKNPPFAKTIEWVKAELVADKRPVLLVETALDGLEVATQLAQAEIAIAGGRHVREAVRRAGELDAIAAANALQIASPGKEPRAIIWLASDRKGLAKALGDHAHSITTLATSTANKKELLAWIESTDAREVFVTGAAAEDIVDELGDRAKLLGPPQQMTLFEALP